MKSNKLLTEKYNSIREQLSGAGEQIPSDSAQEGLGSVEMIPVAISWKDIGLYEPDNDKDKEECEKAIDEIDDLFDTFQKDLDKWQKKYKKLGAMDTVAREQIAQFVAKNLFGLTKLD